MLARFFHYTLTSCHHYLRPGPCKQYWISLDRYSSWSLSIKDGLYLRRVWIRFSGPDKFFFSPLSYAGFFGVSSSSLCNKFFLTSTIKKMIVESTARFFSLELPSNHFFEQFMLVQKSEFYLHPIAHPHK